MSKQLLSSLTDNKIALSVPYLQGDEWKYIKDCLNTAWISSGAYVSKFEDRIKELTGAKYAVALNSGTSALHHALQIAGVEFGDEVIAPTVTFIAPINTIRYVQAEPVFMDCDQYYNIDIEKTLDFIENETYFSHGYTYNKHTRERIKAVIPVHIYGNAVDMAPLLHICHERNICVIEDATESLGTYYTRGRLKGKYTGTTGDIGCYSFNGNKIVTAGGGGMLVTRKKHLADETRYIMNQAKDDPIYFLHHHIGYNYRLNNIQAAMGYAQLKYLDKFIKIKKNNFGKYKERIDCIDGLRIADVPPYASNNYWMYVLKVDEDVYGRSVKELIQLFHKENVEVRPMWYLNHLQKPYWNCQSYKIECAPKMLESTLNIPSSVGLNDQEINKIARLLIKWKK